MTNEQQQVREWMKAFGQETPEKPTIPSLEVRKLRAKLILEEALETVRALGFYCDPESGEFEEDPITSMRLSLEAIADGCEDLKVVTEGTLVACGLVDRNHENSSFAELQKDPLFNEVMRSNWSKMWKPSEVEALDETDFRRIFAGYQKNPGEPTRCLVKDSSGKVIKSPSYSPANLTPIIEEMSK